MADVITRLKLESTQYDSKLRDAAQKLKEFGREADKAGADFAKLSKDNMELAKSFGDIATSATTTKDKVKELVYAYNDAAKAYNSLTKEKQSSDIGKAWSASMEKLSTRIREAKAEMQGLGDEIEKAKSKGDGFGNILGGVAGKFGVSSSVLTTAGAAVAGFGVAFKLASDNISTAMGFEKSISQLSSLTGKTGQELEQLKNYAIELGSSTTLSASQVADAFKMIGSQQPQLLASGEALRDVTKYAIMLSEAAGIDLATAAQTLSTSVNQMGGDSNNAARFVNVLAAASQKGAGDISFLGEAVSKSGVLARAVGTSYEELVANLEMLAKAGMDASTSGTGLRSVIANLEKQSNNEYKPSVVGLTQAFKNLNDAHLSTVDYVKLAGKQYFSLAMTLAENADEAKKLKEEITGTNTAEEQAKTNTDNLDGSLKSLSSAWEGLNLHINDSNGFLRTCVDALKDVIVWADQTFTALGRVAKRQAEINASGGNGEKTMVDLDIEKLKGNSSDSAYKVLLSRYNREIDDLTRAQNAWHNWRSGDRSSRAEKEIEWARSRYGYDTGSFGQQITAWTNLRNDFMSRAKSIMSPTTTAVDESPTPMPTGTSSTNKNKHTGSGSHKVTPQERAQEKVASALLDYSQTITKADLRMEAGLDDELAHKKKELSAQERLYNAYTDAYSIYANPAYKSASEEAAGKIKALAAEVKSLTDTQEATKKATREQENAVKKLADAQKKLASAQDEAARATNLKDKYAAEKKVASAQRDVQKAQNDVNILQGKAPSYIPEGMKAVVTITADDSEALAKVKEIEGVTIEPKALTITADNTDAMGKGEEVMQKLMTIARMALNQSVTITADDAEALAKLQEIEGITLDTKTLKIMPKVEALSDDAVSLTSDNIKAFTQKINEEIGKADVGSALYQQLTAQLADANALSNIISVALKNGIDSSEIDTQSIWKKIFGGVDIPDDVWTTIQDTINENLAKGIAPIKIDVNTGDITQAAKGVKDGWNEAARAVQTVGSAIQQLEDPSAKIAGIVGQAIANIALGFAQATSKAAGGGPFAWIAAIAGGLGTMISTIAAIKSATAGSYAEGGVIPGNHYSGDMQYARVNAGEVILNRAQAGVIANTLEGGALGNLHLETSISAEKFKIMLNTNSMRRGHGEYVTTKG